MAETLYGRIRYILVFELPAFPAAGDDFRHPKVYRLACIQRCHITSDQDTPIELIETTRMLETSVFVQIGVVECAIGRVKSQRGWYIIDRSDQWARTIFVPGDEEA